MRLWPRRKVVVVEEPEELDMEAIVVGTCGSCNGPLLRMAGVIPGASCPCGVSNLNETLLRPHRL